MDSSCSCVVVVGAGRCVGDNAWQWEGVYLAMRPKPAAGSACRKGWQYAHWTMPQTQAAAAFPACIRALNHHLLRPLALSNDRVEPLCCPCPNLLACACLASLNSAVASAARL
eukprot:GHUV01041429.1.p1 GENE.GHUV01041429.1~~GHUV01041429.1.p1  ORF type:complete len:113 (-),score=17.77 GHUV01041429.1:344-682(-)